MPSYVLHMQTRSRLISTTSRWQYSSSWITHTPIHHREMCVLSSVYLYIVLCIDRLQTRCCIWPAALPEYSYWHGPRFTLCVWSIFVCGLLMCSCAHFEINFSNGQEGLNGVLCNLWLSMAFDVQPVKFHWGCAADEDDIKHLETSYSSGIHGVIPEPGLGEMPECLLQTDTEALCGVSHYKLMPWCGQSTGLQWSPIHRPGWVSYVSVDDALFFRETDRHRIIW